jgi:hypothetical protein
MDTIETTVRIPLQRSEPRLSRKALINTLDDRSLVLEFVSVRPYTFIKLTTWFDKKEYIGFGFSKVCYPDKWDAEDGADIAKGHALINVLHQVREQEGKHKQELRDFALPLSA